MKNSLIITISVICVVLLYAGMIWGQMSPSDRVLITQDDKVISSNSTTIPLSSNATFTGAWTSTVGYGHIAIQVTSDVASASGGVKLQYSTDGVNVDFVSTSEYDSSHVNLGHAYPTSCRGRYFRAVYTNGTTTQSYFRLQSVAKLGQSNGAIVDIDDIVLDHHLANLEKSSIVGKTTGGGGGWVDVKVNPSGALTVEATISNPTNTVTISNPTNTVAVSNPTYTVAIRDASGQTLDLLHENDNFNAGVHGILVLGVADMGAGPLKFVAQRLHDDGASISHLIDANDVIINPAKEDGILTIISSRLTNTYRKVSTAVGSAVSVSSVSTSVSITNTSRMELSICNDGSGKMWCSGNSPMVVGLGYPIAPGVCHLDDRTTGAWYCITSTGTTTAAVGVK